MKIRYLVWHVLLVLVLVAVGFPVMAQEAPSPGAVSITGITYEGSGCPEGSVGSLISVDGQALSILFSELMAEDGPAAAHSHRRRDCRVVVSLAYPDTWQYAIYRVDYRGGAYLDEGSWGRQQSRMHITGAGAAPSHMRIEGPYSDIYQVESEIAPNARAWSQCRETGILIIDTSIHVKARHGATALMIVDSVDGTVEQTYRLDWQRCR